MLRWIPEFSTGFPALDEEHRQIIATLNRLEAAIQEGGGYSEIAPTIEFLDHYTRAHFAHEEEIMARVGCAACQSNCAAHHELKQRLVEWKTKLAAGYSVPLLIDIYRGLQRWITHHIIEVDTQLRVHQPPADGPG